MKENSIGDKIEEKYTRYINCETDILELTIEEAIFILEKDASVHYVEDLLQEAYKVILSDYKRVQKENEELKIIKSAIQTLQINSMEDEKYIVISKGSFLDGSYKHLLDDYIPIQKVKNMIKEKEWALENYNCDESDYKQSQAIGAWDILQRLLKESEK